MVTRGLCGHGQILISPSREWGTLCKDGNTKCWGPASCETELGEALLYAEGGRCCYSYPGRCCQAQDPSTQHCRAPAKLQCPQTAAPGLAHLQLGCWQGFVHPQANQGLCPPGPEAHAGAVDVWLHPCGFPHSLDLLPTEGASETLGPGRVPGHAGLGSAACTAARAALSQCCGRIRSEGCGLSLARSRRCREAS